MLRGKGNMICYVLGRAYMMWVRVRARCCIVMYLRITHQRCHSSQESVVTSDRVCKGVRARNRARAGVMIRARVRARARNRQSREGGLAYVHVDATHSPLHVRGTLALRKEGCFKRGWKEGMF